MKDKIGIHTDPQLIKNPFTCKSAVGVRLSLSKPPRKDDTTFVNEYISNSGNHHLVCETNDKLSYCFGVNEEKENTSFDKFDYLIPAETLNETSKVKHTEGLPLSFLQIRSEIDGMEWYKKNYPKMPDELLPIIARYHWGEPITKKGIKKEKKKIEKDLASRGLSVSNKNHILNFD